MSTHVFQSPFYMVLKSRTQGSFFLDRSRGIPLIAGTIVSKYFLGSLAIVGNLCNKIGTPVLDASLAMEVYGVCCLLMRLQNHACSPDQDMSNEDRQAVILGCMHRGASLQVLRTDACIYLWSSITRGGPPGELFVAVSSSGTGNRVMTSPDGISSISRQIAADLMW